MVKGQELISAVLQDPLGAIRVEDLVAEAARDMVKDEVKRMIRAKMEDDPRLQQRMQEAVAELMDAKVRETYALVKLGKAGLDLAVALVPPEMKERIDRDIAALLEKELSSMVSRID